jgi:uncharacterized membrane protein
MIELFAMKNSISNGDKPTKEEKRVQDIIMTIGVFLYMIFWVWAIIRALKCSNRNPDSRAIHIMFASVSPVLYIICSYYVDGFCR